MKYSKKAAMFGLDARVALAIFGALSVITGAFRYQGSYGCKKSIDYDKTLAPSS